MNADERFFGEEVHAYVLLIWTATYKVGYRDERREGRKVVTNE